MSLNGIPCAYLVTSMVLTSRGTLAIAGETICHDRELALELAQSDRHLCAWVGIYALDADGRSLGGAPIFSTGTLELPQGPPARGRGTARATGTAPSAP